MRRLAIVGMAAVLVTGCSSSQSSSVQPSSVTLPLRVNSDAAQTAQRGGTTLNHSVHLSGDEEPFVPATPGGPTPADSHGQGEAIIRIADDELSFDYKLIASNIENITQGHIHCGAAGVNGPIMIWLYPSVTSTAALAGGAGRHDGVLVEGTVTSGATLNVRTIPTTNTLCPGGVATFAQALAKIRAGQAYVNIHTSDGVAPNNTGPGDFPGGEIRGQTGGKD